MKDSTIYAICAISCYALQWSTVYFMLYAVPLSLRPVIFAATVAAGVAVIGFGILFHRSFRKGE